MPVRDLLRWISIAAADLSHALMYAGGNMWPIWRCFSRAPECASDVCATGIDLRLSKYVFPSGGIDVPSITSAVTAAKLGPSFLFIRYVAAVKSVALGWRKLLIQLRPEPTAAWQIAQFYRYSRSPCFSLFVRSHRTGGFSWA